MIDDFLNVLKAIDGANFAYFVILVLFYGLYRKEKQIDELTKKYVDAVNSSATAYSNLSAGIASQKTAIEAIQASLTAMQSTLSVILGKV